MKNLSKFLLFVALVFAGYFSVVVYGACSVAGGLICNTLEKCDRAEGCICGNSEVINLSGGLICNPTDPMDDGVKSEINIGDECKDPDGCNCKLGTMSGDRCVVDKDNIEELKLSNPSVTTGTRTATITFKSNLYPVDISGICGGLINEKNVKGSSDSSITFSNLNNGTYKCTIIGSYNKGETMYTLDIPSFTIDVQGGGSSGGGGGGGSSSATCTDLYLTCVDGIYTLKSGYYCVGGNLGKSCGVSSIDIETMELLEDIKEKKSTVYEYTPQGIKVRIYVPKFKQSILRRTVLSLNQNLYKAINKKLLKVTDPSYMIENFEYLEADSKILVYKEIGSIVKLYNDFLGIFYLFVDMGKRDYLPLARTYFEAYLKEFVMFNR